MMKGAINVWVSECGEFPIPDQLHKETKWERKMVSGYDGFVVTYYPAPGSDDFMDWLHEAISSDEKYNLDQ